MPTTWRSNATRRSHSTCGKSTDIDAAYHMNKRHWNSVRLDGDLPAAFIRKMVRDSYLLVIGGMPRQPRERLTKQFIEAENELNR